MKEFIYTLVIVSIISLNYSCNENGNLEEDLNAVDDIRTEAINKFYDAELVKIYDFIDHRSVDSLIPYLVHSNPIYRTEAALSFASFPIELYTIETLHPALSDGNSTVRKAAAWSIGQGRQNESYSILIEALSIEEDQIVRNNIWEALGKTASELQVESLQSIDLLNEDSLGFTLCVYQVVLQNLHSDALINRIAEFTNSSDKQTRLYTANALARNRSINLDKHGDAILAAIKVENDDECKMSFIAALRNVQNSESTLFLENTLSEGNDNYLILINTLRAYSNRENINPILLRKYLNHENEDLALTAALVLGRTELSENIENELFAEINDYRPSVKAKILGILLKNNKTGNYADYLKHEISNSNNSYEIAYYLKALANDNREIPFLSFHMLSENDAAISTAAVESIVEIKENEWPKDQNFNEILTRGFSTGDVTILGTLADHLRNEDFAYQENLTDISFISTAKDKLELPKEIETYNELVKTEAYLNGTEVEIPSPEWNHPIDWNLVKTISPNQKLRVNTSAGSFVLELKVEDSPGSVVNFLQLSDKGYFDDKFFHRVVPNFVIQTGCPRGDGWGSVPYSIRSEFALHDYKTGAVGMASAGSDTESCQWFVCHSPTPHLEGRYTIFAYVIEGMEIVHEIQVGAKITSIEKV